MTETSKKTRRRGRKLIPTPSEPISPETARAIGQTWFFTGEPCSRGHVTTRTLINDLCHACSRENAKASYLRNPERARARSKESNIRGVERWGGFVTNDPVRCPRCEETKPANAFSKSKFRKNGRCDKCKVCAAAEWQQFRHGPGYEKRQKKAETTRRRNKREDPRAYWAQLTKGNVVARAKARGEVTDIDNAWLLANANDICPLLETPLKYDNTWMAPDSAAIDRIDNDVGYFKHNCWIISALANRIKTNATVEQIETVARNFRKHTNESARDLV